MAHKARYFVATAIVALIAGGQAQAQDTPAPTTTTAAADDDEIIVTARKRQESILNVPVIETVIQQEQLEQLQTRDIKDLGKLVPGLNFGNGVGLSGVQLSVRGVGTTTSDPGIEQTVALNIDGVQMSQGLAFQSGMFDVEQVEVLKGPQALFYGKAAPGGVISVRTADPGSEFEFIGRAAYEFEAEEKRVDMIISGPITDTLGVRLAGLYSRQNGFFKNVATAKPGTGALTPEHDIGAGYSYILRGTVLWEPEPTVNVRLKYTTTKDKIYYSGTDQKVSCPDGTAPPLGQPFDFLGGGEDCDLDDTYRLVGMAPAAFPTVDLSDGGEPLLTYKQRYGSLEINADLSDDVSLSAVTGYYHIAANNLSNGTNTTFAGASIIVPNSYDRTDWTQEVRLNTEFDGAFNLTAGIFVQDSEFSFTTEVATNAVLTAAFATLPPPLFFNSFFPARLSFYTINADIRTIAPFAQLRFNPMPELEIAAGARYTSDKRTQDAINRVTGVPVNVIPSALQANGCDLSVLAMCRELSSSGWQPELTVTYKPSDNLTVFGSLKKGNKPGSFNVGAVPATTVQNAYGDETVKGGELGVKGRAFDRSLTFELAAFHYKYTGLQVGVIEPAPGGVPQVRTINAGSAKTYGVDFALQYRPPQIENLTLHFNGEYNHGRFIILNNVPCWGGQTIAAGCNLVLNTVTGLFTAQNLNGTRLPRAPDWQFNFGFSYEWSLSDSLTLAIANNNAYYSKYVLFPGNRSDFFQGSFLKSDLSLALRGKDDFWEVALIGKNIGNKITKGSCANANYQMGAIYGGVITGGTAVGIAGVDEVGCRTDRGRELWLRFTIRP